MSIQNDALDHLLSLAGRQDAFSYDATDIADLQIMAVEARREQMVDRIRVLQRRVDETGITKVTALGDVVRLLFAHSNYKSYPESIITKGNWERLLLWLQTLSAVELGGIDLDGIVDVDDFLDRVNAAGSFVLCTSGTSGKTSFLPHSSRDRLVLKEISNSYLGWPNLSPIPQDQSAIVIQMAPGRGHSYFVESYRRKVGTLAAPEHAYCMDTTFRIADVNRMGQIRRDLAAGTATPEQIVAFERESTERALATAKALERLVDLTLANRGSRLIIGGTYVHFNQVVDIARSRNIPDGGWEGTLITLGGGAKGSTLPDDYQERVHRFFDGATFVQTYGMSEMSTHWPKCHDGHYHRPPWIVPLILDEPGERLVSPNQGRVEGRFAFVDLLIEGRWGGLVTGDRVTLHLGRCSCGRPGPYLVDPIDRYPSNDDKLSCAGTIDSYIRGFIAE